MTCFLDLRLSGEVQSLDVGGSEVSLYVRGIDCRLKYLEGRCKCQLQVGVRGLPACPGVWVPPILQLLPCVWLGANWWHGPVGVTVTLFSLLSCPPSGAVTANLSPPMANIGCWQHPATGLNVSQGHVSDGIFRIQALASVLTGPRNKGVWGGRGGTFLFDGAVTSACSG